MHTTQFIYEKSWTLFEIWKIMSNIDLFNTVFVILTLHKFCKTIASMFYIWEGAPSVRAKKINSAMTPYI